MQVVVSTRLYEIMAVSGFTKLKQIGSLFFPLEFKTETGAVKIISL